MRVLTSLIGAALVVTACSSDAPQPSTRESTGASTALTSPGPSAFVPLPGAVPAGAGDITAAADVRTVLDGLGFPADWPVPDGLATSDIAGVSVRQSASDERTRFTYGFAFRQPPGDPDQAASDWYERSTEHFGVGEALVIGTRTANGISGRSYSGGLPDEPNGKLTVITTQPDGDGGFLVVETELEIEVAGATTTLRLAPDLLAALPDLSGCTPSVITVDLTLYPSPNHLFADPGYHTIFDGRCATRATFDATVAWAEGRDGIITQDDEHIEVTDTTGPDGTLIHVGAYLNSAVRVDTEQPTATAPSGSGG